MSASRKENINPSQRIFSVIAGAYLLWSAVLSLTSKKKKIKIIGPVWNAASGGYLIYRGISGYCPITDSLKNSSNKLISGLHHN